MSLVPLRPDATGREALSRRVATGPTKGCSPAVPGSFLKAPTRWAHVRILPHRAEAHVPKMMRGAQADISGDSTSCEPRY
jgi:hypothetical protein